MISLLSAQSRNCAALWNSWITLTLIFVVKRAVKTCRVWREIAPVWHLSRQLLCIQLGKFTTWHKIYYKFSLNWPRWLLLPCCCRRRWTGRTCSLPPTSTTCCPTSAGRVCQGRPRVSTHSTARPEHECCFQFKGGSRKVPRQCVVIASFPFITIYRKYLELSREWILQPSFRENVWV